jgi:hypothetical protein
VKAIVPAASFKVYTLFAVLLFTKLPLNVLATFCNLKVVSRNVLAPLFVCTDASTISPVQAGAAKVPSHLRKVVVLFGGVGTAPHTVADITGKSLLIAILGTQVHVVFFNIPVASQASEVPFIFVTVEALLACAILTSPVIAHLVSNGVPSTYTNVVSTIAPTASCAISSVYCVTSHT